MFAHPEIRLGMDCRSTIPGLGVGYRFAYLHKSYTILHEVYVTKHHHTYISLMQVCMAVCL